jgi:hypothetical protein
MDNNNFESLPIAGSGSLQFPVNYRNAPADQIPGIIPCVQATGRAVRRR